METPSWLSGPDGKDASMSQHTPAGWYPDGQGTTRYWDGTAWTEQTQDPRRGMSPVPATEKKDGSSPGSRRPPPIGQPKREKQRKFRSGSWLKT